MNLWIPLASAALLAMPAVAQQAAPPASGQQAGQGRMMRGPSPMNGSRMFGSMSEQGRQALFSAMRSTPEERQAVKDARDRVTALVGADTLDRAALQRAMDDERKLVDAQKGRRQAAILAAIETLSTADRKAFAEATKNARARVEARTNDWRNRSKGRQQPGGMR